MLKPILDSLGFNAQVFVSQIVLFIALWVAMNYLFWKPMLAHLGQRTQDVKDAHREQEAVQKEIEALRADYLARIAQIEADARSRIQTSIKEAQGERERILAEARTEADAVLKQGIAQMAEEKDTSLVLLRDRMIQMAVHATSTALGSTTDQGLLRTAIESRLNAPGPSGNPARN